MLCTGFVAFFLNVTRVIIFPLANVPMCCGYCFIYYDIDEAYKVFRLLLQYISRNLRTQRQHPPHPSV